MRPPLSLMPLIPIAVAMAVGIILSDCMGSAAVGFGAVAVSIALAALKRNHAAITGCAVAAGALAFGLGTPQSGRLPYDRPVILEADIREVSDGDVTCRLIAEPIRYADDSGSYRFDRAEHLYLYIPSTEPYIEAGDRIAIATRIQRPSDLTYFPEETSEHQRMRRNGAGGKAFVHPDSVISVKDSPDIFMKLLKLRRAVTGIIYSSGMDGPTKQLVNILLTGDTSGIDQELRQRFSGAGIAHVLALSGLHVGIIASLLIVMLYPLRLCGLRAAASVAVIVLLWAYAALTGMSASVTRAVVMASVLLLASLLQRRHSAANALCLAAILIMAFDPGALFTVSFQLSFAAVAGILLLATPLNPVSPRRRILHGLTGMLTVTVAAMLATGAVAAYYFHAFPIYFLIANVAIAPLLPVLVATSIFAIILEGCGCGIGWLSHIVDLLASGVTGTAETVSGLPGATVTGIYFSPWLLTGIAAAIGALAYGLHRRRTAGLLASALCAAITVCVALIAPPRDASGIYMIPSYHYTCIAAATPGKVTVISNAGDRMLHEIAAREQPRLRDYTSRRGIDSLTAVNRRIDLPGIRYRYPVLQIGTSSVVLTDDATAMPVALETPPVYLIVCRGFRGTMTDLAATYRPDTIVISSDLNSRLSARYLGECNDIGQPAYLMRPDRVPDLNALLRRPAK